jgi:hypothetical protein
VWSACPDLIRKNYLYDAERGLGGRRLHLALGADAQKWHGEAFKKRIKETFGSEARPGNRASLPATHAALSTALALSLDRRMSRYLPARPTQKPCTVASTSKPTPSGASTPRGGRRCVAPRLRTTSASAACR